MAKNEVFYTVEVYDGSILLVKFENHFIISRDHVSTIFRIINEQFQQYPLLIDISNIDGIDYEALEICNVQEVKHFGKRIAVIYDQSNISRKYAMLLTNVNDACGKMRPFSQYSTAMKWAES